MRLQQLQLAIFYDPTTSIDFDGLSYFARYGIKNKLNIELANNQILGMVPKDAPPEIPRLQLMSENNKFRMQSTLQRSDFFLECTSENSQEELQKFMAIADILFEVHANLAKKIIRVGLVAYKTEYNDEASKSLAMKYLNLGQIGDIDNLSDVNIMFNKPFEFNGQRFNCHLINSAGFDNENNRGLLLRQIDVSSDEKYKFSDVYKDEDIKEAFLGKVREY